MSKFSEKLKELIEDSGTNIYQLAKNAGLDRTTIQRTITGERLPSLAFVEKVCDYLRVSPTERQDFMELYSIRKIGDNTYAGRKYIKELIEQIAALHIHSGSTGYTQKSMALRGDIEREIKTFSGQYSVNQIIRDVLEDEVYNKKAPYIRLTVPFQYTYMFDCLKQLCWGADSGRMTIEHIVRLSKNPHREKNPNLNLEILSHILPFAFCMGNGYQPYYYYAAEHISRDILLAMPYYLIVGKRLITLSADFKTAVLYNNEEIKTAYDLSFQKCLSKTMPLIRPFQDCGDMITAYLDALQTAGPITNTMEPQPCFGMYYTNQMVEDHLHPDMENRESILQKLCQFYEKQRACETLQSCFFSMEGLANLTATGIIAGLPPLYATPFRVEERMELLRSIIRDIRENDLLYRVTDSSKFTTSSLATIELHANKGLNFIAVDGQKVLSCYIDEKSICDAFYDFFESLPESEFVYCKEETIQILEGFLEKLEQMEPVGL